MFRNFQNLVERCFDWFQGRNPRERILVLVTFSGLLCYGLFLMGESLQAGLDDDKRLVQNRRNALQSVAPLARRYATLRGRLDKLQTTFSESEMTFMEVTGQLDRIVRDSIGSDNYDLKKVRTPEKIGFEYEKQEFSVRIPALTLEQTINLLYELERGETPLFLGKVDLISSPAKSSFGATLELFSIRKSS